VATHVVRVDFRDHERHMRLHSKCRRFVDGDRIRLARDRNIISRNIAARAEERDIDLVEGSIVKFLYGDGFTPEWN
jgi:hypothetical protein